MRVLITGAYGFVGGRLIERFQLDSEINLVLASRKIRSREILNGRHQSVVLDVRNVEQCLDAVKDIDCVLHLASLDEAESNANHQLAMDVNAIGTLNMVKACNRNEHTKFIYLSTSQVYGPMGGRVITEQTELSPINHYASTHLLGEEYVKEHSNEATIIRLANSVGVTPMWDSVNWRNVANDLCRQTVLSQRIILKSSGVQHRSFIPLTDVAEVIYGLVKTTSSKEKQTVLNLGSETSVSIRSFAKMMAKEAGRLLQQPIELIYPDGLENDEDDSFVFKSSIADQLETPLDLEVSQMVSHFREKLAINEAKKT